VFRSSGRDKASNDCASEIACAARQNQGASPRHQEIRRAVGDFRESTRLARLGVSDPVAIYPHKANKNGNHANTNEHPVLAFETQEGKMLDKKLQRSRSP
jgi:hypothetical protein